MITYLLAFITMFALVLYLVEDLRAGLISGVAYAFCSYHFSHVIHPTLYNIHWLPLFILSLFMWDKNRTLFFTLIVSLMFAITTYADAYYGYFAGVIALIFVIFKRLNLKLVVMFGIISLLLISPFAWWSYCEWSKRIANTWFCEAVWTDYFYPFRYDTLEHNLFIGYTPLVLAIMGLKRADRFFIVLCIVAFVLSLNKGLPVLRGSARWGLIVMLSTSVMAGYGIKSLVEK